MMRVVEILQSLGGFAGIAAVLAVLPQLAAIKKEVTPNHGSSIKDSTSRIEKTTKDTRALAEGFSEFAQRQEASTHEILVRMATVETKVDAIETQTKSAQHQLGEHISQANLQVQSMQSGLDDIRARIRKP